MTEKQLNYAKILRRNIMATAKASKGMTDDEFHQALESWGFGNSLKKLSISELKQVKNIISGNLSPEAIYSSQNRFIDSLKKQAGWDDERLRMLLLKKFKTTHLNRLNQKQARRVINILKGYIDKEN